MVFRVWIHLSVTNSSADIGNFSFYPCFQLIKKLNAVVYDETHPLRLISKLMVSLMSDIESVHLCLHRITIWRCVNDGKIANPSAKIAAVRGMGVASW